MADPVSPSLSSHSSEPGHPAYAEEENGGVGATMQPFIAMPPLAASSSSSSSAGSQEQAGELTPGTVHRSRSEDAVLRELAGASSSVPSSLPPPVHLARADSFVAAAERKRREGERDENDLSAMLTPAASPSAAMPFASPTAASSAAASSAVSSSAAAPSLAAESLRPLRASVEDSPGSEWGRSAAAAAPTPIAEPPRPLRASVEDSPDGKWSRYKKQLGSGTFKDVYLGVDTESGKEVAWNVVDLRKMGAKDRERITQETELLKTLRHPHIMQIHDVWQDVEQQKIVFITERSAYTLKQHIANLHPAKRTVIKKYSRQILTALEYLHSLSPPIIHRDLKCDNIFIEAGSGSAILGDFGLSIAKDAAISLVGTPGFLAPELFAEQYDEKVDIWSFGMAVFEMATNQFPYIECNGVVSVLLKRGFEGVKPDGLAQIADPQLREFILMCLQPVEKRPSAKQLLEQKVYDLFELPKVADKKGAVGAAASSATPSAVDASGAAAAGGPALSDLSHSLNGSNVHAASDGLDVRIASGVPSASVSHQSSEVATTSSILPAGAHTQWRGDASAASAGAAASSSSVSASAGVAAQSASAALMNDSASSGASSSSAAASTSAASAAQKKAAAQAEASAALAAAKQEALRRRADVLIPKTAVAKTDSPAVVSIFLYARLKDDMASLHAMMDQAVKAASAPIAPEIPDLSRLLLIDIPSYDFTRDNYLAVATSLIRAREDLSHSATELENIDELIQLEQLIACKIEECVREKYDKFSARARTTLNSEIMTLLTSLGMNLSVAQKFIEQEVTYEDLFLLSDADLQEFIPKLGPRRRLQQYLESETRRKAAANTAHAGPHGVHASYASGSDHDDPPEPRKKPQRDSASSSSSSSSAATNGNGHSAKDPARVKKSSTSSGAEDVPLKPKKKKIVDPATSASAAPADSAAAPTAGADSEVSKPKTKPRRTVSAPDESAAAPPAADSSDQRSKTLRVRDEATSTSSAGIAASSSAGLSSAAADSPKDRPKPKLDKAAPGVSSSVSATSSSAGAVAPSDAAVKKKTTKTTPPPSVAPAALVDAAHPALHTAATPPTQPAAMLPPPSILHAASAPSPSVSPAPPKRAAAAAAAPTADSSAPQPVRKSSSVAPVGVASPVGNPAAALSTPSGSPSTPHHSSRAGLTPSLPGSLPSSSSSSTPSVAKSSQRFFDQSGDQHMNALLSKIHHELQPPTAKQKQQQQQQSSADLLAPRGERERDPLPSSPQPRVGVSSSHALGQSSRQTIDALSSTSPSRSRRNSGSSPSAPAVALSMAALAAANANAAAAAAAAAPSTTAAVAHGSSRPTSPLLPLSTHYSAVPAGAGAASTSLFSPTPTNNQPRAQQQQQSQQQSQQQTQPLMFPLGLGSGFSSSSSSGSTPLPAVLHAPEDYPAFSKADSRQPLHGPAFTATPNNMSSYSLNNTAYYHITAQQQQTPTTSQHSATRTS